MSTTEDTPTPRGRTQVITLEQALAMADANKATGFEPTPQAQAVIEAASDEEVAAARKAMDARRKEAEVAARKAAEKAAKEEGKANDAPPAPIPPPQPPAPAQPNAPKDGR